MPHSPRLSIVVPVFQVEKFLRECLDSILDQDFTDFELIAVDDCSPDGSAEILRQYAQQDQRVTIVSLARNVGLGAARNAGLDLATGEYVWFVDSDDVVCRDTLGMLMREADRTSAEVVLFDWIRFFEDGREKLAARPRLLAQAPDRFTASDWPDVLKVIQVAWNKLIRRDLLQRTHLRFPDGYYEDTAFNYPLLASATSITAVPEIVIRYRQRSGAITATRSDGHFEVFAQWARAMTRLAELDTSGRLRTALFPLMIRHCTYVLMGGRRVPRLRSRDYMLQLQSLVRAHPPPLGYEARGFGEKLELAIVRLGSFWLLTLFWRVRAAWWGASRNKAGR
jgi:CDP-glycerol glycerophosphotransferase